MVYPAIELGSLRQHHLSQVCLRRGRDGCRWSTAGRCSTTLYFLVPKTEDGEQSKDRLLQHDSTREHCALGTRPERLDSVQVALLLEGNHRDGG